jgi:hypothetical protein
MKILLINPSAFSNATTSKGKNMVATAICMNNSDNLPSYCTKLMGVIIYITHVIITGKKTGWSRYDIKVATALNGFDSMPLFTTISVSLIKYINPPIPVTAI